MAAKMDWTVSNRGEPVSCARCGGPIHLGTQRYVCNADGERIHERCATENEIKAWRAVWAAPVNLENFSNPEWLADSEWTDADVKRTLAEARSVLAIEAVAQATDLSSGQYAPPPDESTALPAHGPETPERNALRRIYELACAIDEAGSGTDENDEIMRICYELIGE